MCEFCAATTVFDPARHADSEGLRINGANFFEGSDASANRNTTYSLPVGGSFYGELETVGDRDWIAVTLEAGVTYQISQSGYWGGGGTLNDGFLRIYNSSGNQVAANDDGRHGYDSEVNFTPTSGGTFYVSVGSYRDGLTGTYRLDIDSNAPSLNATDVASVQVLADYLVDGYWEATGRDERSFNLRGGNEITVNLTGLTAEGQQLARWALEAWETVADLEFVEVRSGGQITFDDEASGAYATSTTWGTTITGAQINISRDWLTRYGTELNSYSMVAYVHEIGHALGLGHQGNYNGGAAYGTNQTFVNDSWQMSVMSYFSQQENTTVNASYGLPITAMMADIMAIQSIYGAATDGVTAGNSVWGHGSNFGTYLDDAFDSFLLGSDAALGSNRNFVFTIYDAGGIDTLDLSPLTSHNTVDLNDGAFSDIRGRTGAMAIAQGTEIENLVMGSGNDTVTGNELDNIIELGAGNDIARGGAGTDQIWGGAGLDTIYGGDDRDILYGNAGNDLLFGEGGNDLLVGQNDNDTLNGGLGDDVLCGGVGADLFCFDAGSGSDRIKDFDLRERDLLQLDLDLVGGEEMSLGELVDTYGSVVRGALVLTFDTGDRLEFTGLSNFNSASYDILSWV
jgi:serralysin